MMPGEWQRAFLNSGQVITNNNYTLLSLKRFMTLQEEQNQAAAARHCHQQQRVGRQRARRQGRSPGRCSAAMDGGAASPRRRVIVAQPAGSPVQQAPVAAQPFYRRGFLVPLIKVNNPIKVALIIHINVLLWPLNAVVVVKAEVEDLKFIRPNHLIFHRSWLS